MLKQHDKTHIVFPSDCNCMGTIFGAKIMELFDLTCFEHCLLILRESLTCEDAVTVHSSTDFHYGPVEGELLIFSSTLQKIGVKSLTFSVDCSTMDGRQVASGKMVFVARSNGQVHKHGLQNENV